MREEIKSRIAGLDALKFLAVLGVIWIHTPESTAFVPSTAYCRFAVPAFTAASVFLVVWKLSQPRAESCFRYGPDRALHLYVLFLFWNAVYLLARLAKHAFVGGGPIRAGAWTLLLTGVEHHLWYLPVLAVFLIAGGALAWGYGQLTPSKRTMAACLCLVAGIGVGLFPNPVPIDVANRLWTYSFVLGWQNVPALFFAFPMYALWQRIQPHRARKVVALLALLMGASFLWISARGILAVLCLNLSGSALVLSALFWRIPWSVAKLGRLSFGIYAVHMLFVDSIQGIGHAIGMPLAALDLVTFVLAAVASVLVADLLINSRRFSPIVTTTTVHRGGSLTLSPR
jgi:surface polysaccharide O-acyltransferase-like enzyme